MKAEIRFGGGAVNADIHLPASKSISNRVLIIHSIGKLTSAIKGLSDANDTKRLNEILSSPLAGEIDAGEGGTTSRFLMAYMSLFPESHTIRVSGSMKSRPIGELGSALSTLGVDVRYPERDGYFPVHISGGQFKANKAAINGGISSQFVSALMMIGPSLPGGLDLELTGEVMSLPYIAMTRSVMEYFGAHVKHEGNRILIPQGKYTGRDIEIEGDWSAASYWYEIAALASEANIRLAGLYDQSLQGDRAIAVMMEQFGVESSFDATGVTLTKSKGAGVHPYFNEDFSGCPDLAPAVVVTAGALGIPADLPGLKNFRLKESDRASALQREMYRFGIRSDFCGGSKFKVYGGNQLRPDLRPVQTYHDHRMAMSMAPLAIRTGTIIIDDPGVVSKSYPGFYDDLRSAGFSVTEKND